MGWSLYYVASDQSWKGFVSGFVSGKREIERRGLRGQWRTYEGFHDQASYIGDP